MRFLATLALLGITIVSALDDTHYELGFETYNNGKWDAGFNARPEAVSPAGMNELVEPKLAAAELGVNREPVNRGHPSIEHKVDPVEKPKQRHHGQPQRPDPQVQATGQQKQNAKQGKAPPKPAAPGHQAAGQRKPAVNNANQNANAKAGPAAAHKGNAQAKPAAQNRPVANGNDGPAKAAGAGQNGGAAKGKAGHANGAKAAGQQKAAAAGKGQAAKAGAQQAKQAANLQANVNVQHRVVQNAAQQASPMEVPSPAGGSGAQHFAMRAEGDECVLTVYSTVTLVPGTTTM